MTTTEPKSLRERAASATPEAAKAAEKESRLAYVRENFYPKGRGPKHFRGKITEITGPHTRTNTYDGETTEREVMTVHLDASTLQVFDDNSNNPGATSYDVGLPKENEDAKPNSEIVMTVEAARKINSGIKDYFDLEGKVVEMTSDFIETEPRKGEKYGIRIWYYVPTFIGGDNGLSNAPASKEPNPEQASALALSLVGREVDSIKKMDLLKATSKQGLNLPDSALQSVIADDKFIDFAVEQGLIAIEDGKITDPSAVPA